MTEVTRSQSPAAVAATAPSRTPLSVIAGRIISGLGAVLLTLDMGMKLGGVKQAIEGTVQLGYPVGMVFPLGVMQLVCLVLYLIPRTAPIGALLMTGYLGGAVATHVRIGNPLFTHILSPVYFAIILWGGLYLRDPRVRALLRPAR